MARGLLVDDEPDLIEMCEIMLESHGHEVRRIAAPHRTRDIVAWHLDKALTLVGTPGSLRQDSAPHTEHEPPPR